MDNLKLLITDQDMWTSAEGENDGVPFLIRFRPNLQQFITTKKYNKRLTLLWNYDSTSISLMPDEKEMELMEEVENSLVYTLEND